MQRRTRSAPVLPDRRRQGRGRADLRRGPGTQLPQVMSADGGRYAKAGIEIWIEGEPDLDDERRQGNLFDAVTRTAETSFLFDGYGPWLSLPVSEWNWNEGITASICGMGPGSHGPDGMPRLTSRLKCLSIYVELSSETYRSKVSPACDRDRPTAHLSPARRPLRGAFFKPDRGLPLFAPSHPPDPFRHRARKKIGLEARIYCCFVPVYPLYLLRPITNASGKLVGAIVASRELIGGNRWGNKT